MELQPETQTISLQLPFEVRMALMRAAATHIPEGNPLARVMAIEQAIERARAQFPSLFKA
jgi:hypothetical protein